MTHVNYTGIIIECAFILLAALVSVMLWQGKWTFLISGYKKLDPETTDLKKVHHVNAIEAAAITIPSFLAVMIGGFLGCDLRRYALAWMVICLVIAVVYEKTGNRFAKKDS